MKRLLLSIWRLLPFWAQRIASTIIRPRHQVAVGGMIFTDQGHLLLCRHTYRRLYPWGLPGGDLKHGEDPRSAIQREILEETGFIVGQLRLILVENSSLNRQLTLIYLCEHIQGSFLANLEVSEIRYFQIDRLPDLFPEQKKMIEKCLAILKEKKEKGL